MKVAELEKKLQLSTVETKAAIEAHQKLAQENAELNVLVRRSSRDDDGPQPRSQLRSSSARIGSSVADW